RRRSRSAAAHGAAVARDHRPLELRSGGGRPSAGQPRRHGEYRTRPAASRQRALIPLLLRVSLVGFSMAVALVDWRRAWIMAVLCGVIQDPLRKLTTGAPVYMTFSVVAIYAMILLVNHRRLQAHAREFAQRFPNLATWFSLIVIFLLLAAMNGLMTYGISFWKVPLLSLFIYLLPVPAVLIGYIYLVDEQQIYRFFRFYAVLT